MAQKRFNTETALVFGDDTERVNVIPESGASYNISYWTGAEWVIDDKSPLTVPASFLVQTTRVKIEPIGGFVAVTGKGSF